MHHKIRSILKDILGKTQILGSIIQNFTSSQAKDSEYKYTQQNIVWEGENKHKGYCHCCQQETIFEIRGQWLLPSRPKITYAAKP